MAKGKKKKEPMSLYEKFWRLQEFSHLKIDGFIDPQVSFSNYLIELEELTILYKGDKEKKIPDGGNSIEFYQYGNCLPRDQYPIKLIEEFRRFKYDEKTIKEKLDRPLYNPNYMNPNFKGFENEKEENDD